MNKPEIDEATGVETTGHEWDGIKELNNPLPRWWLWTFYGCIAIGLTISVLYPAWPLWGGATPGLLHYSTRGDLNKDLAAAQAGQAANIAKIAATPVAQIAADPELSRYAVAGGASAFKVTCAQCHGTGAEGGVGVGEWGALKCLARFCLRGQDLAPNCLCGKGPTPSIWQNWRGQSTNRRQIGRPADASLTHPD